LLDVLFTIVLPTLFSNQKYLIVKNRITNIINVKKEDKLFSNYGVVEEKYPNSFKKEYQIQLSNGKILKSSKDHIFPYYYKGKEQYKNSNTLLLNNDEKSIENIMPLLENNDLYFRVDKGINLNEDLTYSKLCKELNIEFNYEDEVIPHEDLKLLGLIFTDGTIDKKYKGFRIGSSDINLVKKYIPIINKFRKRFLIEFNKLVGVETELSTKPNYRLSSSSKNKMGILLNLILNNNEDRGPKNYEKNINKELLSLLSYNQFQSFYSGMIDGDGNVHLKNMLSLCNFQNNCYDISELLLWNGVYSTTPSNNLVNIPYNNINNKNFIDNLDISHSNRIKGLNELVYNKKKNRISKTIKRFEYENYDLIRVDKIIETDNIVEMCDIKSSTSYFNYSGVKTHNCDFFDIPYLYCRILKIFGEETANLLSPIKKVINDPSQPDKPITIGGINSLDFMRLLKKYITKEEPSYKLHDIGEKYAKLGKIEYEGNLDELLAKDPEKYIEYNIRDVEILEKLEENLQFVQLTVLISHLCHTPYESIYYNTVLNEGAILTYLKRKNIVVHNKPTTYNKEIKELNVGDFVNHQRNTPSIEGEIYSIDGDMVVVKTKSNELKTRELRTVKKVQGYAGGFLLDIKPGIYKWLGDYDYSSLYPSIIRSLNLGIETLVGRIVIDEPTRNIWWGLSDLKNKDPKQEIEFEILDKETYVLKTTKLTIGQLIKTIESKKWTISANGVCFRTDERSIVASVLSDWFGMRKEYKKKMEEANKNGDSVLEKLFDSQQHSFKILLNAVYGAFAINSWRFTDGYKIMSSAITCSGQRMLIESCKYTNEIIDEKYMN